MATRARIIWLDDNKIERTLPGSISKILLNKPLIVVYERNPKIEIDLGVVAEFQCYGDVTLVHTDMGVFEIYHKEEIPTPIKPPKVKVFRKITDLVESMKLLDAARHDKVKIDNDKRILRVIHGGK